MRRRKSSLVLIIQANDSSTGFQHVVFASACQQALVTQTVIAPPLSPEAKKAQTSNQARKRRATRLMKVGSFCSITSEGDGDIFEPSGQLKTNDSLHKKNTQKGQRLLDDILEDSSETNGKEANNLRKPSDPLSEYSEFNQDDCHSDISELFGRKSPNKQPKQLPGPVHLQQRLSAKFEHRSRRLGVHRSPFWREPSFVQSLKKGQVVRQVCHAGHHRP